MNIREIDVDDDADMHAVFTAYDAGMRHERAEAPVWHEHELAAAYRAPDEAEEHHCFLATDDEGTPLGTASIWLPLHDNLDKSWGDVVVAPEHRRSGVGTALLRCVEDLARSRDRAQFMASSKIAFDRVADHPYRSFAESRGYAQANVEIVRHQVLPVAEADLNAWAAKAAEKSGGYEVTTYVNEFPEELAPSLCTLLGQLAVDAPTGEVDFEEEAMTPERLRQRTEMVNAMGRDLFETVAVRDGVVAAQSTLSVPREGPDGFQWGTFVHREHRGHSLGLAVKVENLRAVQSARPNIRRIRTQNAETNQWMIAVNVLMRYEPFEADVEWFTNL